MQRFALKIGLKTSRTICVNHFCVICHIQFNVRMWLSELFPHRFVLNAFHEWSPVFFNITRAESCDAVCSLFMVMIVRGRVTVEFHVFDWIWFVWRLVFYCRLMLELYCCFSSKHSCRKDRASLDVLQTIATKINGTESLRLWAEVWMNLIKSVKKVSRSYFTPKSMKKSRIKEKDFFFFFKCQTLLTCH